MNQKFTFVKKKILLFRSLEWNGKKPVQKKVDNSIKKQQELTNTGNQRKNELLIYLYK